VTFVGQDCEDSIKISWRFQNIKNCFEEMLMLLSGQPSKTTLNCCFLRFKKNVKNNCASG
jgi:hypothetical protein